MIFAELIKDYLGETDGLGLIGFVRFDKGLIKDQHF